MISTLVSLIINMIINSDTNIELTCRLYNFFVNNNIANFDNKKWR